MESPRGGASSTLEKVPLCPPQGRERQGVGEPTSLCGLWAEEGLREGGRLRRADVEGTAWPLPGWLELKPLREEEHSVRNVKGICLGHGPWVDFPLKREITDLELFLPFVFSHFCVHFN